MVGGFSTTSSYGSREFEEFQRLRAQMQQQQTEALQAQQQPIHFNNCAFSGNMKIKQDGSIELEETKKVRNSLKKLYFRRKKSIN